MNNTTVRSAKAEDAEFICRLIGGYVGTTSLLPRSIDDVLANIDRFLIAEHDEKLAGCVALRDYGGHLYEIRSLAVSTDHARKGIGSQLVTAAIEKVKQSVPCRIFALTKHDELFAKLGFKLVDKSVFPEKIWSDCEKCPKKDHCDEIALILTMDNDAEQKNG